MKLTLSTFLNIAFTVVIIILAMVINIQSEELKQALRQTREPTPRVFSMTLKEAELFCNTPIKGLEKASEGSDWIHTNKINKVLKIYKGCDYDEKHKGMFEENKRINDYLRESQATLTKEQWREVDNLPPQTKVSYELRQQCDFILRTCNQYGECR